MIPVNRITRWPFPGNAVPTSRVGATMDQLEGDEALSLSAALMLELGEQEGAKVFEIIKRLVTQAADRLEGTLCIYFRDPLGEFIGIVEDDEDRGSPDESAESHGDDDSEEGGVAG